MVVFLRFVSFVGSFEKTMGKISSGTFKTDEESEEAEGEGDNADGEDQRYAFVVMRDHP